MHLELDHIFILTEPGAKAADLLVSLGIKESFGRDHKGQGTSNRRFEFSNAMLEFLWIRDKQEALDGPGRLLMLPERAESNHSSPFGIVLTRTADCDLDSPFAGWSYQPDFFAPPMAFHIGENSAKLSEPLCICMPFMSPKVKNTTQETFKSISHVNVYVASNRLSNVIDAVNKADRVSVVESDEHVVEIVVDGHCSGLLKDFRPDIPLIMKW